MSFAGGGPHTRSTQMFIAFEDLDFLGKEPWETPFGRVVEGSDTLDKLFKGYGDIPPFGKGPDQQKIHNRGNAYLHTSFPLLDYIKNCSVTFEDREYLDAQSPLPDPEEERRREEEEEAANERRIEEEKKERRNEEEDRKDEERGEGGSEAAPSDLHSAAAIGDLERVRGLLEGERQRHDIDMELLQRKDDNGWQALHEAVRGGHLEVVQYLVDHGADIGAETANGGTPLVVAENERALGVIELQDIIKPGIQERFDRLRKMGVKRSPIDPSALGDVLYGYGLEPFFRRQFLQSLV